MATGFPSIGWRLWLKALAGTAMTATLPAPVLAGAELGADGFDHPQKIYELTGTLIRRGYSDTDIGPVLEGNFRRQPGDVLG